MKAFRALFLINLKLALREKGMVFFGYMFPLMFFFGFAEFMHAERGGAITYVVSMVLTMGVLGNGLWGAGMRAVQEREANILRRFKVTPITPVPILLASMATGWVLYIPAVLVVLVLARTMYGMPPLEHPFSLLAMVSLGVLAFRAIGLIVASVVNTMQETNIAIQLIYMPMLFLSGATIPITILPGWTQVFSQFLPASYLVTGFQGIFLRRESLAENRTAAAALLLTMVMGTFIAVQLFRWEKGEKMRGGAKVWLAAVLAPFAALGAWQLHSKEQIGKALALHHDMQRADTVLFRHTRIFTGNGKTIESGAVLVKGGRIEAVYEGAGPEPAAVKAEPLDGAGQTLLPGLIDTHVHLGSPGGIAATPETYTPAVILPRELAAYLYSGVTAVRSAGDAVDMVLAERAEIAAGKHLGAELFVAGPLFTAPGGHGTETVRMAPEMVRSMLTSQLLRTPATPDEARAQVRELKKSGVDGIKIVLEAGWGKTALSRMDAAIARAAAEEARARNLRVMVHTGDAKDVAEAIAMGAASIEHGSAREAIPDALFESMARRKIFYNPTLSPWEGYRDAAEGKTDLLDRSLVVQVGPAALIASTKQRLKPGASTVTGDALRMAQANLVRAHRAGVPLVAGTDSGNLLLLHGPALHREMQLWVAAGVPAAAALQAATGNAAILLGAEGRMGCIAKGCEASLVLVGGNPLQDIAATERISQVLYKGERLKRPALVEPK